MLKEKQLLTDLATLRKRETGLPVNIYVDDAGTYLNSGHYKRIKFQKDYRERPLTRSFASMKLDRTLVTQTLRNNKIIDKDIEKIQNFVQNNFQALEELADANISISEFLKIMIPGGNLANKDEILAQQNLLKQYLQENIKYNN